MVHYQFGKIPGRVTDECGMVLIVSSEPAPEIATVRYSLIRGLKNGETRLGLAIYVYDTEFKNGQAASFKPVPLSGATFTAPRFSSEGRLLGGPQPDGSVWLYSPSDAVTAALTDAFSLGPSRLSFSRAGSNTVRAYAIEEGAPSDVINEYVACAKKMLGM